MAAVLPKLCLLAILSGALARPQYITEFRRRAPTPLNHEALALPQTANDYPVDDVEEVAARKRNYQAAFANLASQMAAQSRIFTDRYEETLNQPSVQPLALQTNQNLYHRNYIPISQPIKKHPKTVPQNRRAALFSPVKSVTPVLYLRLPTPQLQETYIYNRVEARQPLEEPAPRHRETLTILPNGYLADTPEVEAAKREHFAAVARARAAAARAEPRRVAHAAHYRPAQRRVFQHLRSGSKPQIYYEL